MNPEFFIETIGALSSFSFPISVLAPIAGGETGVMAAAFVSAQGFFPLWIVFVGSFLGMLFTDTFWFFVARSRVFGALRDRIMRNTKNYIELSKHLQRVSHGRDIIILLISKILIGTRILVILYLSNKRMSYMMFMAYNVIPTFLWGLALCLLGYAAGKGFSDIFRIYEHVALAATFLVVFCLIFYILLRYIRTWLLQK